MQKLSLLLFQLDEARRYIELGRIEALRLALVLLDNAIELQMDRRIASDLAFEGLRESLRDRLLQLSDEHRTTDMAEHLEWTPLSNREKKAIEWSFDAKVAYLSERQSHLDKRLARPLIYLHRYRNEAYHRARVRHETISTASLLLLELNCHMVLELPISSMVSYGGQDTWIEERFGVPPNKVMMGGPGLELIVEDIRSGTLPSPESVSQALSDHLQFRIDEVTELLDYIVDATAIPDREEAFRFSQYRVDADSGVVGLTQQDLQAYIARHDLESLERLRDSAIGVRSLDDRVDAFAAFSVIEEELEALEVSVFDFVAAVDDMINAEIDRQRGN